MTRCNKPVSRLVGGGASSEWLVVTLAPEGLYLREKWRRTQYGPLPYGSLYTQAACIQAGVDPATVKPRRRRRR